MYSVRQIISLYPDYLDAWRTISVEHLKCWEVVRNDESPCTHWDQRSNAELVEAVTDMFFESVHYFPGYVSEFTSTARNGTVWSTEKMEALQFTEYKPAYEMEYAVVHVLHRYRAKVDKELRERCGIAYGELEIRPDQETVPQNVTL
jgi:hypothetical protein